MGITISYRDEDHAKYGFTPIDNGIIRENITDLSPEALVLLIRCLANADGFQMDWKLFEKTFHISERKRIDAIKELETKGHCIYTKVRKASTWEHVYIFFETALSTANIEEFKEKILPNLSTAISTPSNEHPQMNTFKVGSYINKTINNKNNLNNIKENKNKAEINFRMDSSKNFLNNYYTKDSCSTSNTCYIDDHENHESNYTEMFSDNKNLINLNKHGEAVTKLNNSPSPITISKKCARKSFKGTLSDGSTTKNKAQYIDSQEKQPVSGVLNTQAKKLSEQTEVEKETNRLVRTNNVLEANIKKAEQLAAFKAVKQTRRESALNKVMDTIKRDYEDSEIGRLLTDLAHALTEKGICVTPTCYAQLKKDLVTLANNDNERKQMLSIAIAYGLPKLKPLYGNKNSSNTLSTKNALANSVKQEEVSEEYSELAVDENGNQICF